MILKKYSKVISSVFKLGAFHEQERSENKHVTKKQPFGWLSTIALLEQVNVPAEE